MRKLIHKKINLIISFILFLALTIFAIHHGNKYHLIYKSFNNSYWKISILIIIIWCSYIFFNADNLDPREVTATQAALVAFIIAYFAHLDLTISAFWLVWLVSYFFNI